MQYSLADVKGQHHRKFVSHEILDSPEYRTFWTKLAQGNAFTGLFKRIASDGSTVWLNAIYNPILDANNRVVKVVKFASNVTAEQELIAETKGTLKGIDATMATIEFTPDGTIMKANQNFLECMKYSLSSILGKHHRMFVKKEERESSEYIQFWNKLSSGEAITGEFSRMGSDGKDITLKAIYNPITNADGKVVKVVKFAVKIN